MKTIPSSLLFAAAVLLSPLAAQAHVSVASGPAFANTSQEITFGVGHGCEGSDTYSVKIDIPAGVTSVRAETSDFGRATVARDGAGNVTSVTWQKPDSDLIEADDNYYKLTIRIKVPNQPFTTLFFPAHQTCKTAGGEIKSTEWTALPGEQGEPAPALKIVPARTSGWNKFTVASAIADLSVYFSDALIVWRGNSAWSANANTTTQITQTPDVTPLTALASGDEIWVKY
jgi:uncharacterized protein YcnI